MARGDLPSLFWPPRPGWGGGLGVGGDGGCGTFKTREDPSCPRRNQEGSREHHTGLWLYCTVTVGAVTPPPPERGSCEGRGSEGENETRTPEASGRGAQFQLRAPAPRATDRPGSGPAPRGKSAPGAAPSTGCRAGTGRGCCAHPCALGKGRSGEPGTFRKFQRRGWLAAARRLEAPWIPSAGTGRRSGWGIGGEVQGLVRQPPHPPGCMAFRGSQARG